MRDSLVLWTPSSASSDGHLLVELSNLHAYRGFQQSRITSGSHLMAIGPAANRASAGTTKTLSLDGLPSQSQGKLHPSRDASGIR
jgi:hypothetical protein